MCACAMVCLDICSEFLNVRFRTQSRHLMSVQTSDPESWMSVQAPKSGGAHGTQEGPRNRQMAPSGPKEHKKMQPQKWLCSLLCVPYGTLGFLVKTKNAPLAFVGPCWASYGLCWAFWALCLLRGGRKQFTLVGPSAPWAPQCHVAQHVNKNFSFVNRISD